ncbi:xanthine dehydrogenase family protein molybdopterin-binding subunit, partial [SAR202 cluster bacterium AD-804-J14_MRT_500m]|nr:xanthine dehydrogenase family protein molybdopterin-binding subunit [SAR202 cluster bacterium AD-804-J14_MRT_500m]
KLPCNNPPNPVRHKAPRAPGAPAAAFAAETAIDELAEKLNIDPLDLRLLNAAQEGTRRLAGPVFPRIGFIETVQAAKDHPHYTAPLKGPNRGRGVAGGFWFNASGPAAVSASVHADGTISLVEGSPDIGGHRVAVAMHMAEVLGIPVEDVHPTIGDTDSIAFTSMTGGSGALMKTGMAAYEAGKDIRRQLIERAAKIWDVSEDDVDMVSGVIQHKSDPELRFPFKELASMLNATGGPIVGSAGVDPKGVGGAFGVHIADVEVDPETGKIQILRYTAVQDVGTAIHPSYVEGQIQGGAVQGIGWALNEEYVYSKDGVMANPTFLDYRMPISLDLPMIDAVLVEVPNPGHPYGLRGVGETPIVPPMAAIANAVYNALGIRMNKLPMSPGTTLEAIWGEDNAL